MATVPILLDAQSAQVGTTAIPELVFIGPPNGGYAFDAAAREDVYHRFTDLQYGTGSLTLAIRWYSRGGATTGDVVWGTRIACTTPGDTTSMETKAYATAQVSTTTTNVNAKGLKETVITISNLDSIAANDEVWLNIYRDAAAGGDTLVGDAVYTSGYLTYSDGVTTTNYSAAAVLTSAFVSSGTTLQDITGTTLTFPGAGTYIAIWGFSTACSLTVDQIAVAVNVVGGTISGYLLQAYLPATSTSSTFIVGTANNTTTANVARSVTTALPVSIRVAFTCTAAGTCVARIQTTTTNVVTVAVGSSATITKV